jgi:uncharacterized OB-fold protein
MSAGTVRPVPHSVERSASSAPFFDAAAEGRLLIRRCRDCAHAEVARRTVCRRCGSTDLGWEPASGRAVLRSWAINPARTPDAPPTMFALVELDEDPWMESLLLVGPEDHLSEGLALSAVFVRGPHGDVYPAFSPAAGPLA